MGLDKVMKLAIALVGIALIGVIWLRMTRMRVARDEARVSAALVRDSLAATADTTRLLHLQLETLGERLTVVQRRSVQTAQRADALDRALAAERVARLQLSAQFPALERTVRSDSVRADDSSGDRSAVFKVREAPYAVHAEVRLPPTPGTGTMAVRVAMDTLALEVRISCGAGGEGGVRPAIASVVAPVWVTVRMQRVEQEPGVCLDTRGHRSSNLLAAAREWVRARASVTAGIGVTRDGIGAARRCAGLRPNTGCRWQSISRGWLDIWDCAERAQKARTTAALSPGVEEFLGEQCGHFFRERGRHQLIDRDALAFGQLADALVKGVR